MGLRSVGVATGVVALLTLAIVVALGNHGLAGTVVAVAFALAFLGIGASLAAGLLGALFSNGEEQ